MAKILLIVVCVCYCTVCTHLVAAHMMQKDLNAEYKWNGIESNQRNTPDAKQNIQHNAIAFRKNENDRVQFANNVGQNNKLKSKLNPQQLQHREHTKRVKRHADHSHGQSIDLGSLVEMNPNTRQYIRKLFNQFGKSGDTITLNEFEKLIGKLGLHRLIEEQQLIHHDSSSRSTETASDGHESNDSHNKTCVSSMDLVSQVTSIAKNANNKENMDTYGSSLAKIKGQSNTLNSRQPTGPIDNNVTLETIKSIKDTINLGENDFWSLCPILLYQLVSPPDSLEHSGCLTTPLLPSNSHHDHHVHFEFGEANRKMVWIYASLSIIVASLCGLIGVAVIPCMESRYYQYVLQFFVSLAIGTLAGDALLHLMPHAMMSFSTLEDNHTNMTYKGLVAALGIIFFFITERIITMFAEKRKRNQKRDDPPARVRVMRDPDSNSVNNSLNSEKQCKHKYSSYPYCYDEIALETKDNHHQHHQHGSGHSQHKENGIKVSTSTPTSPPPPPPRPPSSTKEKLCAKSLNDRANDYSDTAQSLLNSKNYNNIGRNDSNDSYYRNNEKDGVQMPDNNTILTNLDDDSMDTCGCEHKKSSTPENYTVILRQHESKHHGHSHTHGHVHSPPKSLSAVAWMVVMGDGLHNFTDGMAIGAAFSNSITGGFSTAIAVFCHELPHELGDFAVLLKAGMSAKKAAYYNILSSVLSFLGMVLGIIIGDTPEASAWIFASAAGMFIYIALVDMMPELTTAHNEHSAILQCLIQFMGMIIGVSIMLLIALYEHDLKMIFDTNDQVEYHSHHHDHDH